MLIIWWSRIKEVNLTQLEHMELIICGESYDGEQQIVTARAGVVTKRCVGEIPNRTWEITE